MQTSPPRPVAFVATILIVMLAWTGRVRADAHAPTIASAADLDAYLARTPPGSSPLDRLSPPARTRIIAAFRAARYSLADIMAELTTAEATDVLALFGLAAYVPSPLRATHLSIGASESPATTAAFGKLEAAAESLESGSLIAAYQRDFAPLQTAATLRAMSDGDLALTLRAASAAAQQDESFDTHALMLDLDELDRRHVTAPGWIVDVYRDLMKLRDFDGARAFRAAHSEASLRDIPPIREEIGGLGPTVLTPSADGRALVHRTLTLGPKAQIIVVAGCHFSKDAAIGIEADATLREAFAQHAVWITPASADITDPAFAKWNREHPIAAMNAVERESDWPEIDAWNMPTFYFFRDGRVVLKVTGWETHRDAVVDGLRKLGLMR